MHKSIILVIIGITLTSLGVYVIGLEEITSETIAVIDKTIIGQELIYPTGPGLITSKIITIPIGAETGLHIHEVPMFGYVMEGQITVDYGDMGSKTFVKGDTLVEAINYTHNGKNTGNIPAKILVVILDENK